MGQSLGQSPWPALSLRSCPALTLHGVSWVQWGNVPTWLAAVGTIGAVVVAIWLALGDSRRRARAEQRRQAEVITAWVAQTIGQGILVKVANASNQAAYRLIVSSSDATRQGDRPPGDPETWRAFVSELPPGETDVYVAWEGGMSARPGVEIAFQDSAGRIWKRDYRGLLEALDDDHVSYYGLSEPLGWVAADEAGY